MLSFVADENFNNDILDGVFRTDPVVDVVRVQDVGLSGAEDPTILEWAAEHGRVVLTHDVSTMPPHGAERVAQGKPMPGIVVVRRSLAYAVAIEDILLAAYCLSADEIAGHSVYLPLT